MFVFVFVYVFVYAYAYTSTRKHSNSCTSSNKNIKKEDKEQCKDMLLLQATKTAAATGYRVTDKGTDTDASTYVG